MTSDLFTIKLEKLTYGGEALGKLPDGRMVFVPFCLPGEVVRGRVLEETRSHARAELVEVVQPSPQRIAARCRHFGTCGGCAYQHLDYPGQLAAKTAILHDQLERIGKISNPPIQPIVPSPHPWNYRNHVQFHLTKAGALGFISNTHSPSPREAPLKAARRGKDEDVIPISECHLPEPPLNELWPQLKFDPGLGLERVVLRLGADGQAMLVLEAGQPEPPEVEIEADLSVVHLFRGNSLIIAGEGAIEMTVEAGNPAQVQKDPSLRRTFRVSAGSFFQINTAMAGKMAAHLLSRLRLTPDSTLLDVYCGVGLFSAFLAPHLSRLIGIEASQSACEDFTFNLDEFNNVELYEAAAEDVLPALNLAADTIIVDPPRAGLERRTLEAILSLGAGTDASRGPQMLVYVSCDPSTLARDAARLISGGYRLVEITPFDLFPQTYSIESISIFEKA